MRKNLFSNKYFKPLFFVSLLVCFLSIQKANAQCGVASFQAAGTPAAPTSAWQNFNMGSGTYTDFNVSAGNIYSFRYSTPTVGSNFLDMTVSAGSTVIGYDNSMSPTRNPRNGGICPTPTDRPFSTDWYSTFTGSFRVSTNSWNGGSCLANVPGQSSAILQYKVCPGASDPGAGTNSWNVEAFVTGNIAIPNVGARYGYYVDNNINLVSTNFWTSTSNPGTASTWVGCSDIPNDIFSVRARRVGFPCGRYTISDNAHDDNIRVFVNGLQIYDAACCAAGGVIGDVNGYVLGQFDVVEVRQASLCGGDLFDISFNPIAIPAVNPGTIGGVANGTNFCQGATVNGIVNTGLASGGTTPYQYGGTISYLWEVSTDGGFTYINSGVTTPDLTSSTLIPAGGTYTVRRRATDRCGNTDISNTLSFFGRATPNGSISPANQTICPNSTAVLTLNFTSGSEPFNITYTDGAVTYTRTGKRSGDTLEVNPIVNPTNYSFATITDSFGCVRSSGFGGAANISIIPAISFTSVTPTDATCNGNNTGIITIGAQGGQPPFQYSINNGPFQMSNIFTGLAIGSYSVVVKDDFGCSQAYSSQVTIGEPTDITQTLSKVDASCASVFDGSITVTATGGTPPYSYSVNGGPSQPGNVFNNVSAGNYLVSVFDSKSCLDTASITVNSTYIVSVDTVSKTDISCFGFADGAVTVQVIGGIAPYDYSINGISYQLIPTFSGLSAGTYTIIGRDSKGCTDFVTVTIAQPNAVSIALDSVTDASCNGASNGAIFVTISGGTPTYTYNWSGIYNTQDISGLTAGNYQLTVTDSRGCTTTGGAFVDQPLELFLNVAQTNNLACAVDSTGTVDVTANGGLPAYTFLWSNGETTEDIVNLPAGSYTVTVTDAGGCQKSISQVITAPAILVSSIVGTNANCSGANTGSANLTVSGGTAPYFYQWSTFAATQDVANLAGGLYYVIITDNNGCEKRDSVLISQPAALVLTTAVQNITCFNANNGAINLTVNGGVPNYTFAWSNGATTEDLTGLSGGTYAVTVTDANGCTAATSVLLVNPSAINTSFVVKNPSCSNSTDGRIDLIPSGGTPPYSYAWNNGAGTTEDLAGLGPNTYIVTITDASGCAHIDSAEIVAPAVLFTSGVIKNVTCFGFNDGAVDITAYGGTLPYTFTWSNGPSTEDITNVTGGNYFVSVSDANNCLVASLYTVTEPTVLSTAVTGTPVSCFGGLDGTVNVIATGGTLPYEYLWNTFATSASQSGVAAGRQVVLVTDSNGCHLFDSIIISQPTDILITGVVTNVACNGLNTGAINITVSGGTPTYTFAWSNAPITEDLTALGAGTYTVTAADSKGCTKTASFTVTTSAGLFTNVSLSSPLCSGGSNGFITVEVSGGAIPYTYLWSNAQTGATATNLLAGTYILTVTDINACSATVSATITSPTPITVLANSTASKCSNTATGYVVAVPAGGVAPYVFELNGVIQLSDTFFALLPGQYVIAVRDANGCEGTQVFTISSPSEVFVDLTAPQPVILAGMETQLVATANSGGVAIVNYIWSGMNDSASVYNFSNCGDTLFCSNPYVAPRFTTVFVVAAMNADSCFGYDTVSIIVQNQPSSFIPSAFTPNGDGLNDKFEFDILGATAIEINIFNRWGEQMYYNANQKNSTDGTDGWDGRNDGKVVPYDTYVYQLKVTYFDGIVKDESGTVTLMR